jgi:hypothetical protein
MRDFWQALYDAGADVVLNGHEHSYERFAPQDPRGRADPGRGIREFVVGTGGGGLYAFGPAQPNSEVRNDNTYGVLRLTLRPTGYDWEFVPIAGSKFTDSGSAACVTATPIRIGAAATFPKADIVDTSAALSAAGGYDLRLGADHRRLTAGDDGTMTLQAAPTASEPWVSSVSSVAALVLTAVLLAARMSAMISPAADPRSASPKRRPDTTRGLSAPE